MITLRKSFKSVLKIGELQPISISIYLSIFDSYVRYCNTLNLEPKDISRDQVLFYLSKIKGESLRGQAKGVIKHLYKFCLLQPDKIVGLPKIKRHSKVVEYLSLQETSALLNHPKNKKHRLMLKIEYVLGMRVNEVCRIKKSDFVKTFDPRDNCYVHDLRIYGKGGNIETIPVPKDLVKEIRSVYLNDFSEKERQSDYLFRGQFRSSYSTRSIQNIVTKSMFELGIAKRGNHSTHLLRISRGTHLLLAGVGIEHVSKLLRHKKVETTNKYYNGINTADLRVIFSRGDDFLKSSLISENNYHQKALTA